jgi:hypothetical protein
MKIILWKQTSAIALLTLIMPFANSRAGETGGADQKTTGKLVETALVEEGEADLQKAIPAYKSLIADLERNRSELPKAILRLAESYRKLGQMEEAKALYRRIVKEFPAEQDLVATARKQLGDEAPATVIRRGQPPMTRSGAENAELLQGQIQLLERQLKTNEKMIASGVAPASASVGIKRELLELQRQLAEADGANAPEARAKIRELYEKEIALVQSELDEMRKRRDLGVVGPDELIGLEKSLLALKLEQSRRSQKQQAEASYPEQVAQGAQTQYGAVKGPASLRDLKESLQQEELLRLMARVAQLDERLQENRLKLDEAEERVSLNGRRLDALPKELTDEAYQKLRAEYADFLLRKDDVKDADAIEKGFQKRFAMWYASIYQPQQQEAIKELRLQNRGLRNAHQELRARLEQLTAEQEKMRQQQSQLRR